MKIEDLLKKELNFKTVKATNYRRGGDIGETDEETHSESATDALGTSEDDGSNAEDSDASDGIASASNLNITLGKKKHIFLKKSC